MDSLIQIKDALLTVFGDYLGIEAEEVIEKSVWEGDPAGWTSGSAVATISMEHGMPGRHMPFLEMWLEVSDYMPGFHVEFVNDGVAAVFKD